MAPFFDKTAKKWDWRQTLLMQPPGQMNMAPAQWTSPAPNLQPMMDSVLDDGNSEEALRRPPNAFILYSQDKRASVSQENPTLSNTEVSRILGQMWKTVPNEEKLKYKMKAQSLQEQFKQEHPNYTYRKARRKRALNDLLTKTQNYTGFPGYPTNMMMGMMPGQMMQMSGQMMPISGQIPMGQMPQLSQPMAYNQFNYQTPVQPDQQQVSEQNLQAPQIQIPPAN